MKKIGYGLLLSIFILLFVLVGCSSKKTDESTGGEGVSEGGGDGGTLVIASVREPDTVDVHNTTWVDDANTHIYDRLFVSDDEGNIANGLVEDYEISDDSLSMELKLKEGITFHNGNPVNAEAVMKTFERYQVISAGDYLGPIADMEVIDDLTLKMTWETPFAPFFSNATTSYLGILDTSVLDDDLMGFEKDPIGSGPLKHVETKRGESILYEPFEDFRWGEEGPPKFDQVLFRFISDDETRLLEFKSGNVHVLPNVPPQYMEELEADDEVQIDRVLANGNTYLGFNMKLPIFEDLKVRQAIAKGIDRDPIIEHSLQGLGQPIYGPLPPTILGYSQKIEDKAKEMYSRDVEGAKQLLAEAGWDEVNSNGIAMKDGEPFSVELWMTDEPVMQRIGQIIQNQLKEIGIDVQLMVKEDAAIRAQTPEGAHQMLLWQYGWYDADILNSLFGKGQSTRMHWEPEELDQMLKKMRSEMDMDQRLQDIEDVQDYLVENAPWVPLFVRENVTASRGVTGLEKHPIQNIFIWDGAYLGN
ncbi:ABC transporter substrate-binding protein [Ornithinibacillus sp. 4-3]|uniref:ABC transporter substrate-binding protein n=1 Tax=Ornithinibacillus sp. 4-3 TaxID=3231488 RepID=A0AB39HUK0_9BACI